MRPESRQAFEGVAKVSGCGATCPLLDARYGSLAALGIRSGSPGQERSQFSGPTDARVTPLESLLCLTKLHEAIGARVCVGPGISLGVPEPGLAEGFRICQLGCAGGGLLPREKQQKDRTDARESPAQVCRSQHRTHIVGMHDSKLRAATKQSSWMA